MCGGGGEEYLTNHKGRAGSLVWIELGNGVYEGELRAGLARTLASAPPGQPSAGNDEVWVEWYTRKSKKREWGKSSVAFKASLTVEGGRQVREKTLEQFSHLLPVVVHLVASSSDSEPRVSKRCKDALCKYIKDHRAHLLAPPNAARQSRRRDGNESESESSGGNNTESEVESDCTCSGLDALSVLI